jgi:hypothetical protein
MTINVYPLVLWKTFFIGYGNKLLNIFWSEGFVILFSTVHLGGHIKTV